MPGVKRKPLTALVMALMFRRHRAKLIQRH